jgi:hypothetical protein
MAKSTKNNQPAFTNPNEKIVETTGMADIRKAGEAEAYDRAIEDAQRKGVEEAIGTFVDQQTITEKGVLIKDQISGRSSGYIKNREILKQWKEGGMVYVKVRLVIGMEKLKDDVLALDMAQKRMKMPRVIVYVKESYLGKDNTGTTGTVYNTLISKFAEKKFIIVNRQNPTLSGEENAMLNSLSSQDRIATMAQAIGAKNSADIVIAGSGEARDAGIGTLYGSDMKSYQANVNLQVINVNDGRIMATTIKQGAAPHINPEQGMIASLKKVTEPAADDLINQVLAAWEDILNNGNMLTLKVTGLTMTEGFQFQKALKQYFREVKDVFDKGMENGRMVYTVKYLGDAKDFAMALSTVSFGFTVEVSAYDAVSVTIKATKQ